MATVTPVPAGNHRANLGDFKVEIFNILDPADRIKYEIIRTKNQKKIEGIKVEKIREFTKKTVVTEGSGVDKIVTSTEDLFVIVEYWEKPIKAKENGDGKEDDDSVKDAIAGR